MKIVGRNNKNWKELKSTEWWNLTQIEKYDWFFLSILHNNQYNLQIISIIYIQLNKFSLFNLSAYLMMSTVCSHISCFNKIYIAFWNCQMVVFLMLSLPLWNFCYISGLTITNLQKLFTIKKIIFFALNKKEQICNAHT